MMKVELASGTLSLDVDRADLPLDDLCGFADRHNKRRSFLFVSKVLGKHHPVRPALMADVHALLAGKIDPDLPGPVLFVALAETAVGLGQSVYEAYRARTGRHDTVFVHSTRYAMGNGERLAFSESHSHAPSHLVHVPVDPLAAARFREARSLVLVDDEISTGNTLINLVNVLRTSLLDRVVLTCITDWSAEDPAIGARIGLPVAFASALSGRFSFRARDGFEFPSVPPNVEAPRFDPKDVLRTNFGRLGLCELPALGDVPSLAPGQRVLVLGTGEFLYLPFKLAHALEARGHSVEFQSSTRSPIQLGGAISAKIELVDNYFDGMPNFLYNVRPGSHDVVIVGYETTRLPEAHTLPTQLGALKWMRG